MGLMFTGIALNLLGVFYTYYYVTELSPSSGAEGFTLVVLASWLLSLIGGILAAIGKRKIGSILVIIGSAIFVPLGMVAIFGAVRIKEPTQIDLEKRRQAIANQQDNNQ
ncbi:hypothetical protein MTZ49_02435 [Entomomonas sp. E2T0]|uniref:hypothetical protein n=1 Tax=Entomomonas sp. E2T0 TaxID=2930213 RepID=UPI0022281946|nr:hypothetical protein [Entomomonas sp. E2T0]UYZ84447.1 hypothetical protein MTZ49_02435 [Entomomonas sp. E2T0]